MKINIKNSAVAAVFFFGIAFFHSCKKEKDATVPEISFKEGTGYVSGNISATRSTIYTFGIIADKTDHDLRKLVISVSYDGKQFEEMENHMMLENEKNHYESDFKAQTRNENGSERWKFEVSDKDGNTAKEEINLSVQ